MNPGDQALNFLYLLGCLVLVGSGLLVRRLPLGATVKMALAWLLIFAGLFAIFALKDDFLALGRRVMASAADDHVVSTSAGEIVIRQSDDGHFWIDGRVNGVATRFLVDSGATVTTLSRDAARQAGIAADSTFGVMVDTANGAAMMDRSTANRIEVGPISRDGLDVYISRGQDDTNVIGMNFLSSLSAWSVQGRNLRLKS